MGSEYTFEMNTTRFKTQTKLMNLGSLVMIAFSSVSFIISIIFFTYAFNISFSKSYIIWFFDVICTTLILPGMILLLLGFNEFRSNIDSENIKLLKSIRWCLISYLIVYFCFTIISLPIHILGENNGHITLAKNLITVTLLGAILFQNSFLFNRMEKRGYPTRMLYVPFIFLPIPLIIGFLVGVVVLANYSIFIGYLSDRALGMAAFIVYFYISICLIASFIEFRIITSRLVKSIDESVPISSSEQQVINIKTKNLKGKLSS